MDSNPKNRNRLNWNWARALGLWSCCVLTGLGLACSPDDNPDKAGGQENSSLSRIYKFTSDTSHYFTTSHEGKFVSNTNYLYKPNLENLPWHLGDWEGYELESDDSNILYHRFYQDTKSGAGIYLMAVYGTNESQFHTPEVCYIGDGWKVEERQFKSVDLRDEVFQVRYSVVKKGDISQLVLYWYLWPDSRRNITDGMVMFRLAATIDLTLKEAEESALDFINQLSELKLNLDKGEVSQKPIPPSCRWWTQAKNPSARNGLPTRKRRSPG